MCAKPLCFCVFDVECVVIWCCCVFVIRCVCAFVLLCCCVFVCFCVVVLLFCLVGRAFVLVWFH